MIRKPTEQDFREGTAVTVLRESKRVAVASKDGAGRGFKILSRSYLYGMFWFGILTTAVPAMFSGHFIAGILFIAAAYGAQQLVRMGFKQALPYLNGGKPPSPEPVDPAAVLAEAEHQFKPQLEDQGARSIRQLGDYKLSLVVAIRQALSLAIPGAILLLLGIGFVLLLIPGLALFATAILILFKALFDRDLLSFDHNQVTVNALLAKRSLAWADVVDVTARTHSWFNAKVLMTIGTRRAIVLTARNPQGGLGELLVPIDLLDLDKDGLSALVADLISCRAAGGEIVPAWQAAPPPHEYKRGPASDPRQSFDPDAIRARNLAERAQVAGDAHSELGSETVEPPQLGRRTFGRKGA